MCMRTSHCLSSQAYCLKVKEMDDEEYEASVRYNSQSVAYVLFMHLHVPSMSSTHCYCKHNEQILCPTTIMFLVS